MSSVLFVYCFVNTATLNNTGTFTFRVLYLSGSTSDLELPKCKNHNPVSSYLEIL